MPRKILFTRRVLEAILYAVVGLSVAACFGRYNPKPRWPKKTDPTLRYLYDRGGTPYCPAPIGQSLSMSFFYVVDGEWDAETPHVPPTFEETERAREVIRAHPAVAQKIYEQYGYPRFREYAGQEPVSPSSAAAQEADGAPIQAAMSGNSSDFNDGSRLFRLSSRLALEWAVGQALLIDDTAPPAEVQVVVLNNYETRRLLNHLQDVTVVATLKGEEQSLQASRVFVRGAEMPLPREFVFKTLEDLYRRKVGIPPGDMTLPRNGHFAPDLGHYVAALLAADAVYELCIAAHIRSGALTEVDFPIPEPTLEAGTTRTDDTVILPTGQ